MSDIRKARHKHGIAPVQSDLQGAAKALNRLQDVYRLNTTEFAQGKIMGTQTTAELTAKDTLYLGRFAANSDNNPAVALRWLEEAVLQAVRSPFLS